MCVCVCVCVCVYIYIYIDTHTQYMNCTVNIGLRVSEKSVLPTSCGCSCFQGNLLSFENQN